MDNSNDTLMSPSLSVPSDSGSCEAKEAQKSRKKTGLISRQVKLPRAKNTSQLFEQPWFPFDLVNNAIIAKSLDGTITQWNAAAERMFGYSAREIIGQSDDACFPPIDSRKRKISSPGSTKA